MTKLLQKISHYIIGASFDSSICVFVICIILICLCLYHLVKFMERRKQGVTQAWKKSKSKWKKIYIYNQFYTYTGFQMYMYINQHVHILAKGFDFLRGHLHPGPAPVILYDRSGLLTYTKLHLSHSCGAGVH